MTGRKATRLCYRSIAATFASCSDTMSCLPTEAFSTNDTDTTACRIQLGCITMTETWLCRSSARLLRSTSSSGSMPPSVGRARRSGVASTAQAGSQMMAGMLDRSLLLSLRSATVAVCLACRLGLQLLLQPRLQPLSQTLPQPAVAAPAPRVAAVAAADLRPMVFVEAVACTDGVHAHVVGQAAE